MKVEVISKDQVLEILNDDELFDRVSDGVDRDQFDPPDGYFYLGCINGDDICGFFVIHPENSVTASLHINMLKKHRGMAHGFVVELYKKLADSPIEKWVAKIPECYPDVYKFAKKHGFSDEGKDRLSIVKDGKLIDRYMLGMTKKEMKEWVLSATQ